MLIGSQDVRALYPSIDIDFTVEVIFEGNEVTGGGVMRMCALPGDTTEDHRRCKRRE